MRTLSITETQLLTFFEVEPSKRDGGVAWVYNDSSYEVKQGTLSLSFSIDPAYRDIRIILNQSEVRLYELNSVGIEDIQYFNDKGREALKIIFSPSHCLWLRLKPGIELTHEHHESP